MQNIEQLAREYRNALESTAPDGSAVIEQIIILEENQLDYLNGLIPRLPQNTRRTANYLKNVIYRSLSKLNALIKNTSYVPSFRNVNVPCQSLKSALLSTQISIFVLLDKLPLPYADIAEILSLENRKLGLLSFV